MYMKQNPDSKAAVTVCTVNSRLFGHSAIMDTQKIQRELNPSQKFITDI